MTERSAGGTATAIPSSQVTPVSDGRTEASPGWRIETLWEAPATQAATLALRPTRGPTPGPTRGPREAPRSRGPHLPAELAATYGGPLVIETHPARPTIVANFVATLDGVVSFDPRGLGGGRAVSGGFEPDRFVMGLLRAAADAVLVGAGTVRGSRTRTWTPGRVHPPSAAAYARWRAASGLAPVPTVIIVTASGSLDGPVPWRPDPDQPTIVLTTSRGAARLRAAGHLGDAELVTSDDPGRVPVESVLGLLASKGFDLVLSEAGPTVFGELVATGAVDELFLTLSPRVAGRAEDATHLGFVEGVAFGPSLAPTGQLMGVKRAGDHLFLRYAFGARDPQTGGAS